MIARLRGILASLLRRGRATRRYWLFPAVILVIVLILTALGVSGSSAPVLTKGGEGTGTVWAGTLRTIRSDEFMVRTPLIISQSENGFPRYGDIGVGEHDMTVLSDLPVRDWTVLFRPHQWGYLVLPLENAFAFEWWSVAAILLIGSYVFLLVLLGSMRWALVGSVLLYASPFFHWWYTPATFATAGWMMIAAALLLLASSRRRSNRVRLVLSAVGAWSLVCFALLIYPPWQISVALAVGAVTLGSLWSRWRASTIRVRSFGISAVVMGGLALVPLALFYVTRRPALTAIAQTVYPGARVVTGGQMSVGELFTSWFGLNFASHGDQFRGMVFENESEAASFLFLGVVLLLAIPFVWRYLVPLGDRFRGIVIGSIAVMGLFLMHAFIGLPSIIVKITLLSSIPERRILGGLGIASIILLLVVAESLGRLGAPRRERMLAGVVLTGVTVAYVVAGWQSFRDVDAPIGTLWAIVAVVMAFVPAAIYFWRPFTALCVLVVFGLAVSLSVNPLVRGLSQTRDSALAREVRALAANDEMGTSWVAGTYFESSVLTTAGVRNLSGVNLYPNFPAWELLDPDRSDENVWNRYAQTVWALDQNLAEPKFIVVQGDTIQVVIDPCSPLLDNFGVRHIVTPQTLETSCLTLRTTVTGPEGEAANIYDRRPVGAVPSTGWTVR